MSFSQPYVCTLSPELLKRAQDELREDPDTRHIEVQTLRERLERLPGYKGRTDDSFLLRFLRARKFDQERAFSMVKAFYTLRKENPNMFDNLTPRRMQKALEADVIRVLSSRAPDGSRIICFNYENWDPEQFSFDDMLTVIILHCTKLIEDEETQVCGVTILSDDKGLSWSLVKHFTPSIARRQAAFLQDAFPVRFKVFHHIHEPKLFYLVLSIIRPFLKEKTLKRIQLHGDRLEKLHEHLPPETLPEEFGGTQPQSSSKEWVAQLLACEAQFVEDNKYGFVDMALPATQHAKADATQGLGGTFRKTHVE